VFDSGNLKTVHSDIGLLRLRNGTESPPTPATDEHRLNATSCSSNLAT